jgi:hypothetical protein
VLKGMLFGSSEPDAANAVVGAQCAVTTPPAPGAPSPDLASVSLSDLQAEIARRSADDARKGAAKLLANKTWSAEDRQVACQVARGWAVVLKSEVHYDDEETSRDDSDDEDSKFAAGKRPTAAWVNAVRHVLVRQQGARKEGWYSGLSFGGSHDFVVKATGETN